MAVQQPQPSKQNGGYHLGVNLPFTGFTGFTAGRGAPPPSAGHNWLPWIIGGGLLYYLSKHGYLPELSVAAPPAIQAATIAGHSPTQPLSKQG